MIKPTMTRKLARIGLTLAGLFLFASTALAAEPGRIDTGDTAWVLVSTALVMMMTAPGLALFYGGLVKDKSVLSTLMHSFFCLCLIGVQWLLFGYSLAFGPGSLIGDLSYVFMNGVGVTPLEGQTIPHLLFAMFQGMFAIITVALISGAFAERKSFKAYVLFALLWSTLVYDPLAHWVWGGGWLQKLGALDFAGGTVIHVSSAVSALVACLVIGHRLDKKSHPHNVPFVLIGGGLLWFGWFGFNAGSALGANGVAVMAFACTQASAAVAGLAWAGIEWAHRGKVSIVGVVSGSVAGLASVTQSAGYITIPSAMLIGLGAAVFCYAGVTVLKPKFGYDDTLDVFGVHGIGGTWGAIATGLFATTSVNPAGADGLFYGNPGLLGVQLIAVLATAALAGIGTFVILKVVAVFTPLRPSQEEELIGMDSTLHGETAYSYLNAPAEDEGEAFTSTNESPAMTD